MDLDNDRVLNIMMFDIDTDIADLFYYNKYQNKDGKQTEEEEVKRISFEQTKAAGIDAALPQHVVAGMEISWSCENNWFMCDSKG